MQEQILAFARKLWKDFLASPPGQKAVDHRRRHRLDRGRLRLLDVAVDAVVLAAVHQPRAQRRQRDRRQAQLRRHPVPLGAGGHRDPRAGRQGLFDPPHDERCRACRTRARPVTRCWTRKASRRRTSSSRSTTSARSRANSPRPSSRSTVCRAPRCTSPSRSRTCSTTAPRSRPPRSCSPRPPERSSPPSRCSRSSTSSARPCRTCRPTTSPSPTRTATSSRRRAAGSPTRSAPSTQTQADAGLQQPARDAACRT